MLHHCLSFLRSRIPVLLSFAAVAIALAIGYHRTGNMPDAWHVVRAPSVPTIFIDSWSVPDSLQAERAGVDPYLDGRYDPRGRLFNYPPIWLWIANLMDVRPDASFRLGLFCLAMTLAAMLLLFRSKTLIGSVLVFFAVMAWPVIYAVERGNSEQFVFFPIIAGFLLIARQKPENRWLSGGALITALTMLKVFPIAACVALLRNRAQTLKVAAIGLFAGAAFLLTCYSRIGLVAKNTPQDIYMSYGAMNFFVTIAGLFSPSLANLLFTREILTMIAAAVLALLSVIVGLRQQHTLNRFLPSLNFDSGRGMIAVASLAIFCFTFVRGSSYCYRLMILLGVLAYLIEDIDAGNLRRSLPSAVVLLLFLSMTPHHVVIYQTLSAVIFAVACAWIGPALLHQMELGRAVVEERRHNTRGRETVTV